MNINDYIAKCEIINGKKFYKTIGEHTADLLHCLEVLKQLDYVCDEHLYKLIYLACKYHDYGKANAQFQKRIKSEKKISFDDKKEIVHNILSMGFINRNEFENDEDYYKVVFAVGWHHSYCDVANTVGKKIDNISKALKEFGIENFKKSITNKALKFVNDKEAILLKGFLHKCDYCASAECDVEIKNDFLVNGLNTLSLNKGIQWNDMQKFCIKNKDENIIVVAQTGMGKTEGALNWIGNNKGFFVLPLKTAINAMYDRIREDIVIENVEKRLAILHSESLNYLIENHGETEDILNYNLRAKELSMPLTVTTMDQLFDFVFRYNSYEMKLTTFSYSKIVIDEIQTYGPELLAYLIFGIKKIIEMGGKVAVVTATLPPFVKDLLGNDFKYGEFTNDLIRHNINIRNTKINSEDIWEKYCDNKKNGKDNKILVICNTIKEAQKLYDEINENAEEEDSINVFHTRFNKKDLTEKESAIINAGKGEGDKNQIWITTSIVEASLDIDFDYLFTELQDLNSLFQRLGRCNRKGKKCVDDANCFVYTEIDNKLIKEGNRGFIDKVIFEQSKKAVKEINGKLSESKKLELIKKYLKTEDIEKSDFLREYNKVYNELKNMMAYSMKKDEANLRHINSIDIIPKSIYDEKEDYFKDLIYKIKHCNDRLEKIKLIDKLKEDFITIPYYEYDKSDRFIDEKIISGVNLTVIECNYSSKKGFEVIKATDIATFW